MVQPATTATTTLRAAALCVTLACYITTTAAFFGNTHATQATFPGAGLVTNTVDLLTFETRQPLFTFTFTDGRMTDDQRFAIPDGVEFFAANGTAACEFKPFTRFFPTFEDFTAFARDRFFFDSPLFDRAGTFSAQFQEAATAMQRRREQLAFAFVECAPGFRFANAQPQFNPDAAFAIKQLPQSFNEDTQAQFFDFFARFAPFVVTQCTPGGTLALFSFLDGAFAAGANPEFLAQDAGFALQFAVSGSDEFKQKLDEGFTEHATFSPVFARGGDFTTPGPDAWFDFARFVEGGNGFQCTDFKAEPITNFFDLDPTLAPWTEAFQQATFAFYTRRGCTDAGAFNFDRQATVDDGSCFSFFDAAQ